MPRDTCESERHTRSLAQIYMNDSKPRWRPTRLRGELASAEHASADCACCRAQLPTYNHMRARAQTNVRALALEPTLVRSIGAPLDFVAHCAGQGPCGSQTLWAPLPHPITGFLDHLVGLSHRTRHRPHSYKNIQRLVSHSTASWPCKCFCLSATPELETESPLCGLTSLRRI